MVLLHNLDQRFEIKQAQEPASQHLFTCINALAALSCVRRTFAASGRGSDTCCSCTPRDDIGCNRSGRARPECCCLHYCKRIGTTRSTHAARAACGKDRAAVDRCESNAQLSGNRGLSEPALWRKLSLPLAVCQSTQHPQFCYLCTVDTDRQKHSAAGLARSWHAVAVRRVRLH